MVPVLPVQQLEEIYDRCGDCAAACCLLTHMQQHTCRLAVAALLGIHVGGGHTLAPVF